MRTTLSFAALLLAVSLAAPVGAEELTAKSILISHRAGAPAEGLVALINDPGNRVTVSAAELELMEAAGMPESVITAIKARVSAAPAPETAAPATAPAPAPAPLKPDHAGLEELVRLFKSGISETLLKDQIMASERAATEDLTLNDLLYLKQNGVTDSVIGFLLQAREAGKLKAAKPAEPEEIVFNDLMYTRFLRPARGGRLVLKDETLSWFDSGDSKHNFEFQVGGLARVWLTCEQQTPAAVCHELNFEIVKGDKHTFRDMNRESGSNAAIMKVLDTLKEKFPKLPVQEAGK